MEPFQRNAEALQRLSCAIQIATNNLLSDQSEQTHTTLLDAISFVDDFVDEKGQFAERQVDPKKMPDFTRFAKLDPRPSDVR
ncbi:hypothetical protein CGLAMM_02605 [Acetobacteraceae bacterium EV16G]|uniref:Uncharacterized protein n=1 Tax=Sorlinia euscelidii TaxID=3081148 RepID=A0ABU7U0Z1_9PROT